MSLAGGESAGRSPRPSEAGYAFVAAVVAVALFAALALAAATATRVAVASGDGEFERARASAAADAGLAIAIHGLVDGEEAMLATIGGHARQLDFDGVHLEITVADERGRIPLTHIESRAVDRMLVQAGLAGDNLAIARDSLLDWLDDDDQPRLYGAESAWYAAQGITPRNGGPLSIGELARIRGIGPRIAAQLRPYVTVDPMVDAFEPRHAAPQALAVMSAGGESDPEAVEGARENGTNRVALDTTSRNELLNHPLEISVMAVAPTGGRVERTVVVVLAGPQGRSVQFNAVR